ncbi:MAG: hypothetical protein KGD74_03170 [Candidatus Lokiarchaeota archaeon]|nr:hypothetical protein [Candidatus Lokiarchaeota archaeon]
MAFGVFLIVIGGIKIVSISPDYPFCYPGSLCKKEPFELYLEYVGAAIFIIIGALITIPRVLIQNKKEKSKKKD